MHSSPMMKQIGLIRDFQRISITSLVVEFRMKPCLDLFQPWDATSSRKSRVYRNLRRHDSVSEVRKLQSAPRVADTLADLSIRSRTMSLPISFILMSPYSPTVSLPTSFIFMSPCSHAVENDDSITSEEDHTPETGRSGRVVSMPKHPSTLTSLVLRRRRM